MAAFPFPDAPRAVFRTATDATPGTLVEIEVPSWARAVSVYFTTNPGKLYTSVAETALAAHYVEVPANTEYEFAVSGGQAASQIALIWIDAAVASTVATLVASSSQQEA